jgi:hypothetical protein
MRLMASTSLAHSVVVPFAMAWLIVVAGCGERPSLPGETDGGRRADQSPAAPDPSKVPGCQMDVPADMASTVEVATAPSDMCYIPPPLGLILPLSIEVTNSGTRALDVTIDRVEALDSTCQAPLQLNIQLQDPANPLTVAAGGKAAIYVNAEGRFREDHPYYRVVVRTMSGEFLYSAAKAYHCYPIG